MERQKEIILDGGVAAINYDRKYPYYAVRNDSEDTIYVSSSDESATKGADGVISVPAGGSYVHNSFGSSTLYIRGSGTVTIIAQYDAINPFKGTPGSGSETAWVKASGNPVTLNGLQEGVPFGSIVLSRYGEITISENDKVDASTYSGIVTESGNNGYGNYGWKAFDGSLDGSTQSRWVGYYSGNSEKWEKNWIMYKYNTPVMISYIEHSCTSDTNGWDWKMTVYGSNDGTNFDILGSFEYTASSSGVRLDIEAAKTYRYFKFQTWAAGEIRIFTKSDGFLGETAELSVNDSIHLYEITSNPFEVPYGQILQQEDNHLSVSDPQIQIAATGIKKSLASIEAMINMHIDNESAHISDEERNLWNNHTHSKSEITDFPESLPADGGNADTLNNKHASDFALTDHTHTADQISDLQTIGTMIYTVTFSEITWTPTASGAGKYAFVPAALNVNKIISVNIYNWEQYLLDESVVSYIRNDKQFALISNTTKAKGKMSFIITYI